MKNFDIKDFEKFFRNECPIMFNHGGTMNRNEILSLIESFINSNDKIKISHAYYHTDDLGNEFTVVKKWKSDNYSLWLSDVALYEFLSSEQIYNLYGSKSTIEITANLFKEHFHEVGCVNNE